jgi:uncharacterized protein (DUF2062 family)
MDKVTSFFKNIYERLFKINDTPQRIALGAGLGVFSGILPGTGPLAALFLAFIFRANRAAALLGSLFTNTWLSFVTFILAVRIGAAVTAIKWQDLKAAWDAFLRDSSWTALLQASVLKIIFPVFFGYLIIAFGLGLAAYCVSLVICLKVKK